MRGKKKKIIEYYKKCDLSYQHWGQHEIYEMHYGFWGKGMKKHADSLVKMNQFLSQKMKIKSNDKILDAGCGVGASSIWLAKKYSDINVIGINITTPQVKKANEFAKKYQINNRVKFLKRDYLNTHFDDNSFDVVFAIESVCHSVDKNDFIKEAYRILKPGGRLVLSDYFLTKEKLTIFEKKILQWHLDGWAIPNLALKNNFFAGLQKVGFNNIKCLDKTDNILPSAKIMFTKGYTGMFVDKIIKKKDRVQYANTVTCFFQYIGLNMGLWKYFIFYGEKK